ncbi:UNVERIFIED_CONTAM: hypothetical protein K2H54_055974 [Gekko kuhli]
MRDWNLKFRGILEHLEAYHTGPVTKCNNTVPRNIVATFPGNRTRDAILRKAREGGSFTYLNTRSQVLHDLSADTVQHKKNLNPINSKLLEHKIRFRCELMVNHQGLCLFAHDFPSGIKLLYSLEITHDLSEPPLKNDPDSQTHKFCHVGPGLNEERLFIWESSYC